jgi:hypothetical protein
MRLRFGGLGGDCLAEVIGRLSKAPLASHFDAKLIEGGR